MPLRDTITDINTILLLYKFQVLNLVTKEPPGLRLDHACTHTLTLIRYLKQGPLSICLRRLISRQSLPLINGCRQIWWWSLHNMHTLMLVTIQSESRKWKYAECTLCMRVTLALFFFVILCGSGASIISADNCTIVFISFSLFQNLICLDEKWSCIN